MYTIESYVGSISEGDELIEQGVTKPTLNYTSGFEHPMELPLSVIAWRTPMVEPDNYEVLGSGETPQVG